MDPRIRADVFISAMRAAARAESVELDVWSPYPNPSFESTPFSVICSSVPEIEELLSSYIACGGTEPDPAEAFFSVDPPGLWLKLTELVGPDSHHEGPLKQFLESQEAFVITLNQFLAVVEMNQDFAYEDQEERLDRMLARNQRDDNEHMSLF